MHTPNFCKTCIILQTGHHVSANPGHIHIHRHRKSNTSPSVLITHVRRPQGPWSNNPNVANTPNICCTSTFTQKPKIHFPEPLLPSHVVPALLMELLAPLKEVSSNPWADLYSINEMQVIAWSLLWATALLHTSNTSKAKMLCHLAMTNLLNSKGLNQAQQWANQEAASNGELPTFASVG